MPAKLNKLSVVVHAAINPINEGSEHCNVYVANIAEKIREHFANEFKSSRCVVNFRK